MRYSDQITGHMIECSLVELKVQPVKSFLSLTWQQKSDIRTFIHTSRAAHTGFVESTQLWMTERNILRSIWKSAAKIVHKINTTQNTLRSDEHKEVEESLGHLQPATRHTNQFPKTALGITRYLNKNVVQMMPPKTCMNPIALFDSLYQNMASWKLEHLSTHKWWK